MLNYYSPVVCRHSLSFVVYSTISMLLTKFLCVNMTPFGMPVVPLEYGNMARSFELI